jgi:hypothetical protein
VIESVENLIEILTFEPGKKEVGKASASPNGRGKITLVKIETPGTENVSTKAPE